MKLQVEEINNSISDVTVSIATVTVRMQSAEGDTERNQVKSVEGWM